MRDNRLVVQLITSMVFFWALFRCLADPSLFLVLTMVAAGYVWKTNDYTFETPRATLSEKLNSGKSTKSGPQDNKYDW